MPKYKSYIKGMNNDLSQDLLAQYQIVILAVSGGYAQRSDNYFLFLLLFSPGIYYELQCLAT